MPNLPIKTCPFARRRNCLCGLPAAMRTNGHRHCHSGLGSRTILGVSRRACRGHESPLRLNRKSPALSAHPAAHALLLVGIRDCALAGAKLFCREAMPHRGGIVNNPALMRILTLDRQPNAFRGWRSEGAPHPVQISRARRQLVAATAGAFDPCPGCCSSARERPCSGKISPPAKRRTPATPAG